MAACFPFSRCVFNLLISCVFMHFLISVFLSSCISSLSCCYVLSASLPRSLSLSLSLSFSLFLRTCSLSHMAVGFKPMGSHFGGFRCTAHFRTDFSGWIGMFTGGTIWILTHGHMPLVTWRGPLCYQGVQPAASCHMGRIEDISPPRRRTWHPLLLAHQGIHGLSVGGLDWWR